MMTKIVCRLLTLENQLLGWCEHHAAIKGDGYLRASRSVQVRIAAAGAPANVSLHWCDVNVEVRVPWTGPTRVQPGDVVTLFEVEHAMFVVGLPPVGLPPVTVGHTAVGIPVGTLTAVAHA